MRESRNLLLAFFVVSVAMTMTNCHKETMTAEEAYYTIARFTEIPDTSSASYKSCLRVVIEDMIRVGLDTANYEMSDPKEDSVTYLFQFGPKPPPVRVKPDGTLVVTAGGGPAYFIRRADCGIEKVWMFK